MIEVTAPERALLILRRSARRNDHWSAQYAFPGGRCEAGDSSLLATAIRETAEECGIHLAETELVRELPVTPAARSTGNPLPVAPFHFRLQTAPPLELETAEIQSACWLALDRFLEPRGHALREMLPERLPGRLYPSWPLGDYYLWGFTYELVMTTFGTGVSEDLPVESIGSPERS